RWRARPTAWCGRPRCRWRSWTPPPRATRSTPASRWRSARRAVAPSRRCPGGTRSRRCSAREAPPRRGSTVAEPRLERPHPGERRLDPLGVEPAAHEALLNRREGGPSGRAAVGKAIVGDEQDVSARREGRDGRGLEPPALLDRAHPEI